MIGIRLAALCLLASVGAAAAQDRLTQDQLTQDRFGAVMDRLARDGRADLLEKALPRAVPSGGLILGDVGSRSHIADSIERRIALQFLAEGALAGLPEVRAAARRILLDPQLRIPAGEAPDRYEVAVKLASWMQPGTLMVHPDGKARMDGQVDPRRPGLPIVACEDPKAWGLSACPKNRQPARDRLGVSLGFVVSVEGGPEGTCSGALVAPNAVLTARHCVPPPVPGAPKPPAECRNGQSRLTVRPLGATRSLAACDVVHLDRPVGPNQKYFDVALIRLSAPVVTGASYQSAAVAPVQDPGAPYYVVMAGYGITVVDAGARKQADDGLYYAIQVLDFQVTRRGGVPAGAFALWSKWRAEEISHCAGDSGGPVFIEGPGGVPQLVGVIATAEGSTNVRSVAGCRNAKYGAIVDLGHPDIRKPVCALLRDFAAKDCALVSHL